MPLIVEFLTYREAFDNMFIRC